jgi:hypothetical protein
MLESLNKNEAFEYKKLSPEEMKARGILGQLVGPCADFINPTRNGRGYGEELWEKVFDNPIVNEKIDNKCFFGELGHPAEREEDVRRVVSVKHGVDRIVVVVDLGVAQLNVRIIFVEIVELGRQSFKVLVVASDR